MFDMVKNDTNFLSANWQLESIKDLQREIMYSALLFPYRNCVTKIKKKKVPSVSLVVKDSLK